MAETKLEIIIGGKNTEAKQATADTESAIGKLGNTLKGLAIGAGALVVAKKAFELMGKAIKEAAQFMKEATQEAGEEEQGLVRLGAILKATGNYTEDYYKTLTEASKAIQNNTTLTDESVISAEAQLSIYKLTGDQMKEATQAAIDMAAATGMDLSQATMTVGKAMEGITTPLRRYGIILDDNKVKTEGYSYILGELNSRFGGAEAAMVDTWIGRQTQVKNQLGELKETIGAALIPSLQNLAEQFLTGAPIIDAFGKEIGRTESPLKKLQGWVQDIAGKIQAFAEALARADWTPVIEGMESIGEALGLLISGDTSFQTADEKAQGFVNTLGKMLETTANIIAPINYVIDATVAATSSMANWIAQWNLFWANQDLKSAGTKDNIDNYAKAVENARGAQERATIAQENAVFSAQALAEFYGSGEAAAMKTADAQYALENGLIAVNGGFIKVADATETAAETAEVADPKFKTLSEALSQAGDSAATATQELSGLYESLMLIYNINQSVTEATWSFDDAIKAAKETVADKTSTDRELQTALFEVQDQYETLTEKITEGLAVDGLSISKKLELQTAYMTTGQKAVDMGIISKEAFIQMAKELGINTDKITGNLKGIGTQAETAGGEVKSLREYIEGLKSKTITITTNFVTTGTAVQAGGTYISTNKQFGGMSWADTYAPDLGIPILKGEGVIPRELIKAIKQGRGSFSDVKADGAKGINLTVLITGNNINSDMDLNNIEQKVSSSVMKALRMQGAQV